MTRDALAASAARAVFVLQVHSFALPCLRKSASPKHRRALHSWRRALPFAFAHSIVTHSCRPSSRSSHMILFIGRSAQSGAQCRLRLTRPFSGPTSAALVRESARPFYAARAARVRCQPRNRRQQISASLRATATRAIFAPERFRTRV